MVERASSSELPRIALRLEVFYEVGKTRCEGRDSDVCTDDDGLVERVEALSNLWSVALSAERQQARILSELTQVLQKVRLYQH